MSKLPGKFVWFELNTTDTARAKAFYTELLNWKADDVDMGDVSYTMIKNGEDGIGGIVEAQGGAPSHWISYLSVDDVDAAASKVTKNGGKQVVPPTDIPVGRFAIVADPQGAHFALWRGADADSPDKDGSAGSWHWNELWSPNAETAVTFYESTFGYSLDSMDMGGSTYHVLKTGEVPRGGIMTSPVEGVPPNWLPYVQVDDTDAAIDRCGKLGGAVMAEAQDVPGVGRFAIVKDPTGAAIGIIKPEAK
jgi:hypothetical protein